MADIDHDFLAPDMRDEIRAVSTTVLRMDGSVQSMAQELDAISGLLAEQSPPSP
jgi:hypothetical protein